MEEGGATGGILGNVSPKLITRGSSWTGEEFGRAGRGNDFSRVPHSPNERIQAMAQNQAQKAFVFRRREEAPLLHQSCSQPTPLARVGRGRLLRSCGASSFFFHPVSVPASSAPCVTFCLQSGCCVCFPGCGRHTKLLKRKRIKERQELQGRNGGGGSGVGDSDDGEENSPFFSFTDEDQKEQLQIFVDWLHAQRVSRGCTLVLSRRREGSRDWFGDV